MLKSIPSLKTSDPVKAISSAPSAIHEQTHDNNAPVVFYSFIHHSFSDLYVPVVTDNKLKQHWFIGCRDQDVRTDSNFQDLYNNPIAQGTSSRLSLAFR